jgi:hypothetical protein
MGRGVATGDGHPSVQGATREVRDEPVEGPQQRGLARPGPAHDEAQLALLDVQVDPPQAGRRGAVVGDPDPVELDHAATSEEDVEVVAAADGVPVLAAARVRAGRRRRADPLARRGGTGVSQAGNAARRIPAVAAGGRGTASSGQARDRASRAPGAR